MKRVVVLMQGLPGSGKSTYARALAKRENGFIVSADYYFERSEAYRFDPSELGNAHAACFRTFLRLIRAGAQLVIVDNVNDRAADVRSYIRAAKSRGYRVKVVRVLCDLEVAYRRGVHGVPMSTLRRSALRLESFPSTWPISFVR